MNPKPLHAAAHIIHKISCEHAIGAWHEPHGTIQHVAHFDEASPGVVLHARLGESGLQLLRAIPSEDSRPQYIAVCLPLDLLFDLANNINPQFKAGPDKTLSADQVERLAEEFLSKTPAPDV